MQPFFLVDAFVDGPFTGNPAGVCLCEDEPEPAWMQQIAAEVNQAETAFLWPIVGGYRLRWFTPKVEVDLCGHATMAAAHALWESGRLGLDQTARFETNSGPLECQTDEGMIWMNFPAEPPIAEFDPAVVEQWIGVWPIEAAFNRFDVLARVESEAILRAIEPDLSRIGQSRFRGLIVTAASDQNEIDFVSRFFAPACGVDEDHATGSAHCCLGPYWSRILGKDRLTAFQASPRGARIEVAIDDNRVLLGGRARTFLRGELADLKDAQPGALPVV